MFARFTYSKEKPAVRVHVWDLFDQANMKTTDFHSLWDSIYDSFEELFADKDLESDVEEISLATDAHTESLKSSDSIENELLERVNAITNYSVFDTTKEAKPIEVTKLNINEAQELRLNDEI